MLNTSDNSEPNKLSDLETSKIYGTNVTNEEWLTYDRDTVIREGLYFRKDQFDKKIMNYEWSQYGNIHVYSHIYENEGFDSKQTPDLCKEAAKWGQLGLLKYLHEHGYQFDQADCFDNGCDCQCRRWKYIHDYCTYKVSTCVIACIYGNLECLIYAHENGSSLNADSCSDGTCNHAAENGQLECLKYAFENGCDIKHAAAFAAKGGYIQCLDYALNNGAQWSTEVCSNAAKYGHIDILKYAHESGCPWDNYTCINAAKSNELDCLKYAFENGCSIEHALFSATYANQWVGRPATECMKYLTRPEKQIEALRKCYKKCKTLSNIRFLQRFVRNRNVIKGIPYIPGIGNQYLFAQSHYEMH